MKQANFYKKSANLSVICQLCHHSCLIKNQAYGRCLARKNLDGCLFSLVYGRPAALGIDPIEKKPLFHFLPGSLTYSLGTLGCNFRCANCQNWNLSQTDMWENDALPEIEPVKIVEQALTAGCRSIAYTYNEPTIFAEYALDIMKLARKEKLKNVWVSNGYMSNRCLKEIIPYLDAANIDLKSFDNNFYLKNCGAELQPILENLKYLKNTGAHLEITTLIIPGLSDNPDMLKTAAKFISEKLGNDVPWHLSKFSPKISWKLKKVPATPEQTMHQAYKIGKSAGLKYIYLGNLPGDAGENTYCPACGQLAVRRIGYKIKLPDSRGYCPACEEKLDIIL